ncbi:type II toxin-antitoxin system Phd/YefM family antitoxin [Fortiea sp. LEGE XX443]|uniref:type II toxin-antitoxin system Phd/YefM family antitoxin n=1 Tax=Fortiea sp. LEGE XX443 TaxID=1828611 RepID=UPI0018815981|nr:type II toxin-antitoxin system Phd/YefM family antitoxin [Fortiea sp. LEGE XX443]MBE9004770.1 type II toxin-antitoxin system Phd/YefM family antitoxin [Fortiea sp. LEGE XX443]
MDITLAMLLDEVTKTHSAIIITPNGKLIALTVPCESISLSAHNYPLQGMQIIFAQDFGEPIPEV